MTKRLTLALHLFAAKSVQDYLDAHDGDAAKALAAAQRDVAHREGQNSSARAFVRAYTKLVETLKLPTSPDDADAASDAALSAVRTLSEAGASSSQITAALTKLGLDPTKLEEQVAALKAQAEQGAEGLKLKRELAYRDAADALGYDASKLTKILRDEQGLPEKRTVKTTVDGKEVSTDTWGFPSADGKTFTSLTDHADVKGFEAALKKEAAPAAPPAPSGPSFPQQRASTTPTSGVKLDPASLAASIAANGAGSI